MIPKQIVGFRLLLLADPAEAGPLHALLASGPLAEWEVLEAESPEHARFLQQWNPCDVVLVDSRQLTEANRIERACLTLPRRTPLVVLSDSEDQKPAHQAGPGPEHWLPRGLVLEQPALLATVLQQAAQFSQLDRLLQHREEALQESQRQVNRLVSLLWNTVPAETPWFTQRQMVARLHEEVVRSQRYGDDLAVVVGEMADSPGQPLNLVEPGKLTGWLVSRLGQHKRGSDVAGQYGPLGFMLLLTQTNEEGATQFCRRLQPLLQCADTRADGIRLVPRIRFGLAGFSPSSATVTRLLARAEERLDQARQESSECLAS